VILGIGVALTNAMHKVSVELEGSWILGGAAVLAYAVSSAILVADQRSTTVVLRPSKFRSLQGSGLFLIIPLIDTILLLDRHPPPHEQPNERNSELKKETPIDI
jgi:regulator of protease activity HflC (stomatin/prohibitin superfamily)